MQRLSSLFRPGLLFLLLLSCTPTPPPTLQTSFYLYRFDPPAFVEFSGTFQPAGEIPFSIPASCGLLNVFSPSRGNSLAIELSCPNGQTVLFLDTLTKAILQPVRDADSHFLAWSADGRAAYLKIDSLGSPRVVLASTDGATETVPIPEFTYDLAASGSPGEFTFTLSGGLGQGSELWSARRGGKTVQQLVADPYNYISFTRFSPDGRQIAFIKIPDSLTPFSIGELWVMDRDGSMARKVADADAGHGYAASWSPDGKQIAFVVRENPADARADQSSEALVSNIYIADVQNGELRQVTRLESGHVEAPLWSPDGNTLAFNAVIDDRMEVQLADLAGDEVRTLITEPACCPAWLRK